MALSADDPWLRWDWLQSHQAYILQALGEHVQLTLIAIVLGGVIALPLSLAAWRWRGARGPILGLGGLLYTIPSLALFALLIPFTGLSTVTAEVGLVSYTILILVRNTVIGLESVPADAREAAIGLGYTPTLRLLKVDLPLALPVIFAGLRIATVTTIGLVTVTAVIGEGGLGKLIEEGLIRDFKSPLLVGSVLSVALAIGADLLLALIQRQLTPWARTV